MARTGWQFSESFHSLDTFIADQCFALKLDPQQFESTRAYQLATRFMEDMMGYNSAEQLAAFINTAKEMIGGPQQASPQVIEHFSQLVESQAIINSEGDPEVLQATIDRQPTPTATSFARPNPTDPGAGYPRAG